MIHQRFWPVAAALLAVMIGQARADDKDAKAILDKAIAALGGEEKLGKAQAFSWKSKGTVVFNGNENEMNNEVTVKGLDHFRREFGNDQFHGLVDNQSRELGEPIGQRLPTTFELHQRFRRHAADPELPSFEASPSLSVEESLVGQVQRPVGEIVAAYRDAFGTVPLGARRRDDLLDRPGRLGACRRTGHGLPCNGVRPCVRHAASDRPDASGATRRGHRVAEGVKDAR